MLKLIQLGLTFSDAKGDLPRWNGELCVWQFNFRLGSGFLSPGHSGQKNGHACFPAHAFDLWMLPLCREFKQSEDMFAQDSIELLKDSGIDFARNEARGIEVHRFGEVLMSSGIVLNEDVRSPP
jgi:CCR4-NOT transcription complex subunit 7/8